MAGSDVQVSLFDGEDPERLSIIKFNIRTWKNNSFYSDIFQIDCYLDMQPFVLQFAFQDFSEEHFPQRI